MRLIRKTKSEAEKGEREESESRERDDELSVR